MKLLTSPPSPEKPRKVIFDNRRVVGDDLVVYKEDREATITALGERISEVDPELGSQTPTKKPMDKALSEANANRIVEEEGLEAILDALDGKGIGKKIILTYDAMPFLAEAASRKAALNYLDNKNAKNADVKVRADILNFKTKTMSGNNLYSYTTSGMGLSHTLSEFIYNMKEAFKLSTGQNVEFSDFALDKLGDIYKSFKKTKNKSIHAKLSFDAQKIMLSEKGWDWDRWVAILL
jgi:hypothetical protein